jgi:adenylosuccinate lyase
MAEAFVIALGKTDLGRQEAHELVRKITMDAEKNNISFSEAICNNKTVKGYLTTDQIEESLKPENYIGHSEEIIDKVLGSL